MTKSPLAIALVLGAFAGLGQAPQGLWGITLVALSLWFLIPATSAKTALRTGLLFGAGYFAVSLRWIVSPFLIEPASTGWMAPFALILMAIGGGLFWGFARWASYKIAPNSRLLSALVLVLAELLRSYIFTGFPWALLGHIWIDTPVAQLAAYGGPHLLTAITVGLGYGISLLLNRSWWAVLSPLTLVLALQLFHLPDAPKTSGPTVRLVQPNAKQSEKWDPEKSQIFFNRMLDFTGQGDVPDLVVWPETAISYLLDYAGPELELVAEAARGAPTVLGINRSAGLRYYNAFIVVERGGIVSSIYDKAHIVPFGEFIPGGELLRKIGIDAFAASTGGAFTAGTGAQTVDITGIGHARPLICYEGIFAEEMNADTRPRLMILITNDAWFGPDAGPEQHLAQARLRAIEQGLPMVRVANTGISAMIDAKGRITAQIGMNESNFIDATLPPALNGTIYSRIGDWPFGLALLFAILSCAAICRRNLN